MVYGRGSNPTRYVVILMQTLLSSAESEGKIVLVKGQYGNAPLAEPQRQIVDVELALGLMTHMRRSLGGAGHEVVPVVSVRLVGQNVGLAEDGKQRQQQHSDEPGSSHCV
ncbi:hypothetical protein PFISCL1PPCAC_26025 [Pristionchus fissidentatus]|uniref:Uncharacterized protein n=1 Tax=Pristionchus fissidentatus TaxID=1538716 RepID=A0AAV5WTS7_9BILA|nr:hypothetical protein PFISCL1PPCAC_26025 [Pristionchus fissidentatus]